jgi:very-short-patch-repair endonuclease
MTQMKPSRVADHPGCELLVAILNDVRDFHIARDRHWYRIPVSSVNKFLRDSWPPQWLAFYQTLAFGQEAHSVRYYAQVLGIKRSPRWQLFPEEPRDDKSHQLYFQLFLEPLRQLPLPILSRRLRRIIFISTTWQKFINASEINDLYYGSPLEDRLWAELKRRQILTERQEFVEVKKRRYELDFVVYCANGNLDLETDGDTWHANAEGAAKDNRRDNALESRGWRVLRFTTAQINEEMSEYCIPTIADTVNSLGGVDDGGLISRKIDLDAPDGAYQMRLFDNV